MLLRFTWADIPCCLLVSYEGGGHDQGNHLSKYGEVPEVNDGWECIPQYVGFILRKSSISIHHYY